MRLTVLWLMLMFTLSNGLDAMAQERQVRRATGSEQVPLLTETQQDAVLVALLHRIDETYLFQDSVEAVTAYLRQRQAAGAYRDATDAHAFVRHLTDDLRARTNDLHFGVTYEPERYEQMRTMLNEDGSMPDPFDEDTPGFPEPGSPLYEQLFEQYRRVNFFLSKVENLEGNIGYLRLDQMPPLDLARPTVDAAMAFLAYSDAVILDLRDVPGGVGGFIPYLISYFMPPDSLLLYTREFSAADTTVAFYTYRTLPGKRLDHVPLYVLTSGQTGSAAENLAYTLKHHGRATIIGEATRGGAHSATMAPLVDGFLARIPVARVVHPVTRANWERVGVQPDVDVRADEALYTAQHRALDNLLADTADPQQWQVLEQAQQDLERTKQAAEAAPEEEEALKPYAGTYGIRTITLEQGRLMYQRQGGPKLPLRRVEGERFELVLPRGAVSPAPIPDVRFERDAQGHVHGLSLVHDDGRVEGFFEKEK